MKKTLAIALSILMVASLLSIGGCSSNKQAQSNKKYTLTYWTLFSGGDGDVMTKMVSKFNDTHTNIQVKIVPLDWGAYYTKVETAVAANKGPDVGVSHITKIAEFVKMGAIIPLDKYTKAAGVDWSVETQSILKNSIFDGKHYSIPLDTHPYVLFYNKTLLQNAGALGSDGKPSFGSGWDGFVSYLDALKSKLPSGVSPLSFPTSGDDGYRLWWTLYKQMGGNDLVNSDVTAGAVDTDIGVKAATDINNLFHKDKVSPVNLADYIKTFDSGKAAITMGGVWNINTFQNTSNFDYGVMPIPQWFNNDDCWADSHNIVLPKQKTLDTGRETACVEFMYWLCQNSDIWAEAGHIPTNVNVQKSATFNSLPKRPDYVDAVNHATFPLQNAELWPIKDNCMIKGLDPIWAGTKTPEQVFSGINSSITNLLKG